MPISDRWLHAVGIAQPFLLHVAVAKFCSCRDICIHAATPCKLLLPCGDAPWPEVLCAAGTDCCSMQQQQAACCAWWARCSPVDVTVGVQVWHKHPQLFGVLLLLSQLSFESLLSTWQWMPAVVAAAAAATVVYAGV